MANLYIAQAYVHCDATGNSLVIERSDTSDKTLAIFSGLGTNTSKGGTTTKQYIIGNANYNIYYLGIQAPPGTRFIINNQATDKNSTIRVGQTGIFELNLIDSFPIQTVTFLNLEDKLKAQYQNANPTYCLIDVIYSPNTLNTEGSES